MWWKRSAASRVCSYWFSVCAALNATAAASGPPGYASQASMSARFAAGSSKGPLPSIRSGKPFAIAAEVVVPGRELVVYDAQPFGDVREDVEQLVRVAHRPRRAGERPHEIGARLLRQGARRLLEPGSERDGAELLHRALEVGLIK